MDVNTTPLIDVMLVLLIMFIITIPIQTHAVKLDLPQGTPPTIVNSVKNKVITDPQRHMFWNGQVVDATTLRNYLDLTKQMADEPELQIQPDPNTPYDVVDQLLAIVKDSQVSRVGFVGNENYAYVF